MTSFRLKLTLPQGAQFEAEGNEEFIQKEKDNFLRLINLTGNVEPKLKITDFSSWQDAAYLKDNTIALKVKYPDLTPSQAVLLILAIGKNVMQISPYPALNLSKSLKKSGYIKGRVDRIIASEIKNATIMALGTKRNRTYQITQKGLAKAYILLERLTKQSNITGVSQYLTKYASMAKN